MMKIINLSLFVLLVSGANVIASYDPYEDQGGGSRAYSSMHTHTYEALLANKYKDYPPALRDYLMRDNVPMNDAVQWLRKGYDKSIRDASDESTRSAELFAKDVAKMGIDENKDLRMIENQITEQLSARRAIYNTMYSGAKAAIPYEKQLKANYDLLATYGKSYVEKLSDVVPVNKQDEVGKINASFNLILKQLADTEKARAQYQKAYNDRLAQTMRLEALKKEEEKIMREMEELNKPPIAKPPASPTNTSKGLADLLSEWWFIEN